MVYSKCHCIITIYTVKSLKTFFNKDVTGKYNIMKVNDTPSKYLTSQYGYIYIIRIILKCRDLLCVVIWIRDRMNKTHAQNLSDATGNSQHCLGRLWNYTAFLSFQNTLYKTDASVISFTILYIYLAIIFNILYTYIYILYIFSYFSK